jgi:hypothetical protein
LQHKSIAAQGDNDICLIGRALAVQGRQRAQFFLRGRAGEKGNARLCHGKSPMRAVLPRFAANSSAIAHRFAIGGAGRKKSVVSSLS